MLRRHIHIPRTAFQVSTKSLQGRQIKGIIFDLSGTIIDPFGHGPITGLYDTFRRQHIILDSNEVRCATGNNKLTHIKEILKLSTVQNKWIARKDKLPTEKDADDIFAKYRLIQTHFLQKKDFTTLIPNTLTMINYLRKKYGILYGGTTGYDSMMVEPILHHLKEQGFEFNIFFASDQIPRSRPYPDGIVANLAVLNLQSSQALKIGDTYVDMEEGKEANCVCVGMTDYSDMMGKCMEDSSFYSKVGFDKIRAREIISKRLILGGADFVIPDITSLGTVVEYIKKRS
jgi:phosphonoacetaldehyde hydrolase